MSRDLGVQHAHPGVHATHDLALKWRHTYLEGDWTTKIITAGCAPIAISTPSPSLFLASAVLCATHTYTQSSLGVLGPQTAQLVFSQL